MNPVIAIAIKTTGMLVELATKRHPIKQPKINPITKRTENPFQSYFARSGLVSYSGSFSPRNSVAIFQKMHATNDDQRNMDEMEIRTMVGLLKLKLLASM